MNATMEAAAMELSVKRVITVKASCERAFRVYTEKFNSWWPREHHILPGALETAVIEPRAGGRVYERTVDGKECDWGKVLAFEPPHRLLMTWILSGDFELETDAGRVSEVEVRFFPEGPRQTRVELVHRGIERHTAAEKLHAGVSSEGGWASLLQLFATLAETD